MSGVQTHEKTGLTINVSERFNGEVSPLIEYDRFTRYGDVDIIDQVWGEFFYIQLYQPISQDFKISAF